MKKSITLRSLLIISLTNAAFIALCFFLLRHVYVGVDRWVEPFPALEKLTNFLHKAEKNSIPILLGAGVGLTIISWILVSYFGNKVIAGEVTVEGKSKPVQEKPKKEKKGSLSDLDINQPSIRASLQMLVILQRQGRLVDFLQENLDQYDDAQIGAAVRNIQSDCKATLNEHIRLEPVFKDEEGQEVDVPEGFDSQAIQLTGNVKGDPPFRGVLRHRGWKAVNVKLPKLTVASEKNSVVAPAEVEIL